MFRRGMFTSRRKENRSSMNSPKLLLSLLLFLTLTNLFPRIGFATTQLKPESTKPKEQTAGPLPVKTGDLYALVVGVSKYRDPKIPKLDLSEKDARAFGDFLKTQNEIFKETRVTYLLNEKATKLEVEKYLYYTLPKAGLDDTVILYFSGHGAFEPIRPTEFLFLPYDVETEFIGTTGVKMSGLEFLKGVNAERVLIIADACYAGGFSQMKPKSLAPSLDLFMQEARNSSGRAIITSSKLGELSWEAPNAKNSVFTHNFLEGLKGKADKNKDGIVTLNQAYEYAYAKTNEETAGRQHPQFEGKLVGHFPLSFVGPRFSKAELKKRFLKAAESGDTAVFERLLTRADIEARDDDNDTALILAATGGQVSIVKALLETRADVDATSNSRATALSRASENGHAEVAKLLLTAGANVNPKNADGLTPLALACTNGHLKVAEILLTAGADLKARANTGDTALSRASAAGYPDIVKLILRGGQAITSEDLNAETALTQAVRAGHSDIVKLLLPKTAGIKLKSYGNQERRFLLAVLRGDLRSVMEATEHSANIECRTDDGDTALGSASALGNKEIVKHLLAKGADINAIMDDGSTALMLAARTGHTEVVNVLVSGGADVNATDKDGNNALMLCAEKGEPTATTVLLSKKCDVNAKNGSGSSALLLAAKNGHADVVKQLLSTGADVHARDNEGNTALMVASSMGHLEAVKILVGKDAEVNAKNHQRRTALIMAAINGHKAVVKLLLSRGSDPTAEDWERKTALMLASEKDRQEVVEILTGR